MLPAFCPTGHRCAMFKNVPDVFVEPKGFSPVQNAHTKTPAKAGVFVYGVP